MSNPWKNVPAPTNVQNLTDIMSEEYAKGLQVEENMKFAKEISEVHVSTTNSHDIPPGLIQQIEQANVKDVCESDAIIAQVLQCQFDKEYDDEIRRVEKKKNGDSKISVSYDNFCNIPKYLLSNHDIEEDDNEATEKKDWDRFETNEREFASLPKKGYMMKNGEIITKHDSILSGRRNACRVMAFPPDVCTGDGAGFDMKLPNSVFNHLKEQTKYIQTRKNKMLDRKEQQATTEMGIDEPTRIILYKLINIGLFECMNGIVSTGKESIVIHANGDISELTVPRECAVKVFKTTLNEFKTRDKYIEADYRFKDRFSKQNPRKIVHMWAEKEMHNLMRLQKIGLKCPTVVCLKKHVLVMSFIGKDHKPAPKLKDVILSPDKWNSVYKEVVDAMHRMYNEGHFIHADLSEFNILWWDNKCWFIDVSQSVQPDHPNGLQFLLRDCHNITNFFEKKEVEGVKAADDLFKFITGYQDVDMNFLEGAHTSYNSLSSRFEISLDDNRNTNYPFDYCWQKTKEGTSKEDDNVDDGDDTFEEMWTHSQKEKEVDVGANFGNELITAEDAVTSNEGIIDKKINFGDVIDGSIPQM